MYMYNKKKLYILCAQTGKYTPQKNEKEVFHFIKLNIFYN